MNGIELNGARIIWMHIYLILENSRNKDSLTKGLLKLNDNNE